MWPPPSTSHHYEQMTSSHGFTLFFLSFSLHPPHCCAEMTVFVCSEARWKRRIQLSGNLPTLAFVSFSFLSLPSHSLFLPLLHPSCPFWIRQIKLSLGRWAERLLLHVCVSACGWVLLLHRIWLRCLLLQKKDCLSPVMRLIAGYRANRSFTPCNRWRRRR